MPTRIKAKFAQDQMNVLFNHIPTILTVYQAYEDLGYDKDKILQKFKDHTYIDKLKTDDAKVTYGSAGQELADQDSRRHSWTNEDPDWHSLAASLDAPALLEKVIHAIGVNHGPVQVNAPLAMAAHPAAVVRLHCLTRQTQLLITSAATAASTASTASTASAASAASRLGWQYRRALDSSCSAYVSHTLATAAITFPRIRR